MFRAANLMITSSKSSQDINLHFRQWVKVSTTMVMVGGKKVGGYLSLMGGFLLHLTLGTLYCFGNMNTYMTSYLRTHVPGQVGSPVQSTCQYS